MLDESSGKQMPRQSQRALRGKPAKEKGERKQRQAEQVFQLWVGLTPVRGEGKAGHLGRKRPGWYSSEEV